MEKIQRKIKIEKQVNNVKSMFLYGFKLPEAQLDDWIRMYKESEWEDKTFNDKDVDLIIETLKSLPGYSPERFIETAAVFEAAELEDEKALDYFLRAAYMYLSMVNPDLFEVDVYEDPDF